MNRKQRAAADAAVQELQKCHTGDEERDHIRADKAMTDLLHKLGFSEVVSEYEKVTRWCA